MLGAVISLGVNDSPLSRQVLAGGTLPADFIETSGPHTETAIQDLPHAHFLLHNGVWNWSLGHPAALEQDHVLQATQARLALTRAPWLSVHLGFSAAEVRFGGSMQPVTPPLGREVLLGRIVENVREFRRHLKVPLLLENLDFNATGAYDHICEPSFITRVLENADVDLLLDLAHARVSADRLGMRAEDYLSRLPLSRVRQIHVSGPRRLGNTLSDSHETLQTEDYQLLARVLEVARPWALTLEYSREAAALVTQLQDLRRFLGLA